MRVLGIDFGGKRIGVAAGETEHSIASPRPPLSATGTLRHDATNIHELAKKEQAEAVVLGLPLIEGEETKMSRICRMLGTEIEKLGLAVHYVDESLSSMSAESNFRDHDWTSGNIKKHIDGEAACQILERYFRG